MSKAPAMPLFCGDYLAATVGLSLEQSGAFLHILMAIWASGGKPIADDDEFLARICRVTRDRWQKKIRPALAPLFDLSGGTWRNERLEREWTYVQGRIEAQRANGAKGGRPPKNGPNGPNLPTENREENTKTSDAKPLKYNDTPKPNGYVSLNPIESTLPNSSTLHEEDTIRPADPIEPAAAPIGAAGEKVVFIGRAFTLNAKSYEDLRKRCFALRDFHGAVQTMDQVLSAEMAGKPLGKIYAALNSKMFAKHELELRIKAERAERGKPPPASQDRTGIPNALHAKRARHG